jgi:16S rRNA (uracil1498-N3)-methyltransferase
MSANASSPPPEAAAPGHPPRFHAPGLADAAAWVRLPPGESRHAARVLRLAAGAAVELFDGAGHAARGVLSVVRPDACDVAIDPVFLHPRPAGLRLRVALPRGAKQDWIVEKAVELGARELLFFESARSVARLPADAPALRRRRDRWREQALAAAKQSGNDWPPDLASQSGLETALAADAGAPVWFAGWAPDAVVPREGFGHAGPGMSPALYIGPEGGWSAEEMSLFGARGIRCLSLGPRVLRVETAVAAALAAWLCMRG